MEGDGRIRPEDFGIDPKKLSFIGKLRLALGEMAAADGPTAGDNRRLSDVYAKIASEQNAATAQPEIQEQYL